MAPPHPQASPTSSTCSCSSRRSPPPSCARCARCCAAAPPPDPRAPALTDPPKRRPRPGSATSPWDPSDCHVPAPAPAPCPLAGQGEPLDGRAALLLRLAEGARPPTKEPNDPQQKKTGAAPAPPVKAASSPAYTTMPGPPLRHGRRWAASARAKRASTRRASSARRAAPVPRRETHARVGPPAARPLQRAIASRGASAPCDRPASAPVTALQALSDAARFPQERRLQLFEWSAAAPHAPFPCRAAPRVDATQLRATPPPPPPPRSASSRSQVHGPRRAARGRAQGQDPAQALRKGGPRHPARVPHLVRRPAHRPPPAARRPTAPSLDSVRITALPSPPSPSRSHLAARTSCISCRTRVRRSCSSGCSSPSTTGTTASRTSELRAAPAGRLSLRHSLAVVESANDKNACEGAHGICVMNV